MPRRTLQQLAQGLAVDHHCHHAFLAAFHDHLIPELEPLPGLRSPDALGDLLETLRNNERQQAFAQLIDGSLRHDGTMAIATTQRFTPAWIARWLVERGLDAVQGRPTPILDPACGGGRLLLEAYRVLISRGWSSDQALEGLIGFDRDPLAAHVASWALWLEVVVQTGSPPSSPPRIGHPGDNPTLHLLGSLGPLDELEVCVEGLSEGAMGFVVMNPPYMGARHMSPELRQQLRAGFGPFAGDLYTAFLKRCVTWTRKGGGMAVLCQQSFLFLKRDRVLRQQLFAQVAPRELLHLGAHAFEGVTGEKASVVAFTAQRGGEPGEAVRCVDLTDLPTPEAKRQAWQAWASERPTAARLYTSRWALQRASRGEPLAYWWPDTLEWLLESSERLGHRVTIPGGPNKTANNAQFVRFWWEVPEAQIGGRWIRYAKGGPHQKWGGNLERVVDWSEEARCYYAEHKTSNLLSEDYWFREGITWSDFGGRAFSARWLPPGCVFDMAGPALFVEDSRLPIDFWLGLLNAPLVCHLLNADNPTIHYQVSNVRRLPLPSSARLHMEDPVVQTIVEQTRQARALQATLARWNPRDPARELPIVLEVHRNVEGLEGLEGLCTMAEQWVEEHHRRLAAVEQTLALAVEELYGVERCDVAVLDGRYRPPQRRKVKASVHLLDALDYTQARAAGEEETLWGAKRWAQWMDWAGGALALKSKIERHRVWRARRRPVHATRGGSLWGEPEFIL